VDVGLIGDSQCGGMQGRYGVDRRESGSRFPYDANSTTPVLGSLGSRPGRLPARTHGPHDACRA
jgi:hypothetical protein